MIPSPVITFADLVMCSHGGNASPIPPIGRVLVGGVGLVLTVSHKYVIKGCVLPAATSGAPPCISGALIDGTKMVFSMGSPLATLSVSMTSSKCVPNPTPLVSLPAGLPRVLAQ
jgi:hypothetical protein